MKVTNRDVFEGRNAIQELLRCRLPVKPSYQVAKLSRKLNEALKDIDVTRRVLIEKYGTESKRGGKEVNEDNPNFSKFMSEFGELLSLEVNVVADMVKIPDRVSATCDKCSHNMYKLFEIEPWILAALDKFIEVA